MATSTVSGTLTADQPTSTGVAGGSLTLPIDNKTAWSILMGGTFSSGSTVLFEFSVDGVTYTACSMVQDGTSNPSQTSLAGPQASPISFTDATGDTAGKVAVRARCHPYHAGDAITVSLTASGPSAVTTNAGTGTSTASLALEAGGNLAAVATTTGATADAAVQGDNAGSISAKLRGIAKSIAAKLGITIADGDDATLGAKADAAWTSGSGSVVAVLKAIAGKIPGLGSATSANSLPVVVASDQGIIPVQPKAGTAGGASSYHLFSGTGTNATVIKASAGTVYTVVLSNPHTVAQGVHLYNLSTTPSAGSATGVVATYIVPPGDCRVIDFPVGMAFGTGIGITTIATSFSDAAGSGLAGVFAVDVTYA